MSDLPTSQPSTSPNALHADLSDKEVCAYIAEMCSELRVLARRPGFRSISYLLEMVRLDAERIGKDSRD